MSVIQELESSIERVLGWIEGHDYKGYEPSDGNLSFLHPLTFGLALPERILQQVVWKLPVDIRPLVGVPPHQSTKGMGYMASGYLWMYRRTQEEQYRQKTIASLDWLIEHRSPQYDTFAWGNDFPFSSRGGQIPRFEPTIVWTSLIGHAFLDAHETIGDDQYLEVASSVCDWILSVPREETSSGTCLSYIALRQSSIHNSNMLGSSMLARAGHVFKHQAALDLAKQTMEYTCSRQQPDGAWTYGADARYQWIDNFHTGYNLDCLRCYIEHTGDKSYEDHLARGLSYYKSHFFESDGRPKYYHDRTYPIDIQSASQSIDTLALFSDMDPECLDIAQRVAAWTIEQMQDKDGHFYYRDLSWKKVKTPMFHWGQATMFKAMAFLLSRLSA